MPKVKLQSSLKKIVANEFSFKKKFSIQTTLI